jgi:DNA-binding MarR family transcriptional regulator
MAAGKPLFSFESPDDSPGFLLWQTTNLWQREIKKALDRFDLTHAQFVVLASAYWLGQQQAPVTQVALAEHARIDKMMTSKLLRTLEAKGLLVRAEHEHDTRAKVIELTQAGTKTLVQAVWAVEEFDTVFFGVLGTQQASLSQQLKTLLKAGSETPPDPSTAT